MTGFMQVMVGGSTVPNPIIVPAAGVVCSAARSGSPTHTVVLQMYPDGNWIVTGTNVTVANPYPQQAGSHPRWGVDGIDGANYSVAFNVFSAPTGSGVYGVDVDGAYRKLNIARTASLYTAVGASTNGNLTMNIRDDVTNSVVYSGFLQLNIS